MLCSSISAIKENQSLNSLPSISIITPSLNQAQFIEETVLSVLNQNYPNLEHIVIDGGSTDQTLEILKKYVGRIKWISEKDKGQADAVNKGIKMATGEIIGWLNSDDTYEPGCIKLIGEHFGQNRDCLLVYGDGFQTNSSGSLKIPFRCGQVTFKTLSRKNPLLQPSIFFRKEVLSQVGYLDVHYHYVMDYELWVRIFQKCEPHTAYLPLSLSSWRLHEETKTALSREKIYNEIFEVLEKYYGKVFSSWLVGYIGEITLGYSPGRGMIQSIFCQKWNPIRGFRTLSNRFGFLTTLAGFARIILTGPFLILTYLFASLRGKSTRFLLRNDKK